MTAPAPATPTDDAVHASAASEVLRSLGVDPASGLAAAEVETRRARHGPNRLPRAPGPGPLQRFLAQLADPLVLALLVAAVIAAGAAMSEHPGESWLVRYGDPLAILLIVLLNAVLGFVQEGQAAAALESLEAATAHTTRVRRDGADLEVDAADLVPGDIVELEAGDAVPADLRVLEAHDARCEESALTGESVPVEKDPGATPAPEAVLAERPTMAFLGTNLVTGHMTGVVAATGPSTELGRIDSLAAGAETPRTPLQRRLDEFGLRILAACLVVSAALFLVGVARADRPWLDHLLVAVSLAVAAIPEGLPAITTITLALGMRRMADRGAVVRQLPAVETLGSATVICTDKTGTLTENRMTVREVRTGVATYAVEGSAARRRAVVRRDGAPLAGEVPEDLRALVACGVRCNHAGLEVAGDDLAGIGDPTEVALLVLAEHLELSREALGGGELVEELPFDSDRQRMCLVVEEGGVRRALVKGAPEAVLPRVTRGVAGAELDDAGREALLAEVAAMAGEGLRVLALAEGAAAGDDPEADLRILGLVGILDPARPGVADAVADCHAAGIRVAMITGDHPKTAAAIARELGIWREDSVALEAHALRELDDDALAEVLPRVAVFARVSPAQKLRIVRALQAKGEVVAMTGDGVNDAPALRAAEIGVAMGRAGTDVAREAARMVLLDDDFTTIVDAIKEGRTVFRNIQKFVYFLLSVNTGLVVAVIVAALVPGLPQLTPIQLLWINLVTNGLPALALGLEPFAPHVMARPPRPPAAPFFDPHHWTDTALFGVAMGAVGVALLALPRWSPGWLAAPDAAGRAAEARTLAFAYLALAPLAHAFNCRSTRKSLRVTGLRGNPALLAATAASAGLAVLAFETPALRPLFRTAPLAGTDWAILAALALGTILLGEGIKGSRGGSAPQG